VDTLWVRGAPDRHARRGFFIGSSILSDCTMHLGIATTRRLLLLSAALGSFCLCGCGTTRWTDTNRTGTEQLVVSDAVDRAVSGINFRALSGKQLFLDHQFLAGTVDEKYLISSLRQHMLASGCTLKDKREDADYIVEARSGALGTDRHDLLFGVPQTNIGAVVSVPGVPTQIPEIPLAKRTVQKGIAKVAVFAYHRESGRPVWQSGVSMVRSDASNTWIFGIGPFQRGTIHPSTVFAGEQITYPLSRRDDEEDEDVDLLVTHEALFERRQRLADLPVVAAEPPSDGTVLPPSVELPPDAMEQVAQPEPPPARPEHAADFEPAGDPPPRQPAVAASRDDPPSYESAVDRGRERFSPRHPAIAGSRDEPAMHVTRDGRPWPYSLPADE
jgi:hypothetical protein